MKIFNLLLLWCSVLFTNVLADNESIANELIYFYYVYKMEFLSGATKTMAVDCEGSAHGGMCYFDEFVEHLIEDRWLNVYDPLPGDHTITPGDAQIPRLERNLPSSARYKLSSLLSTLNGETAFPIVLQKVLHAANEAFEAAEDNDVTLATSDINAAVDNARAAKEARNRAIFDLQQDALSRRLDAAIVDYVQSTASGFKWPQTFQAIDDAVDDGELDKATAKDYKSQLRTFSKSYEHDIISSVTSEMTHLDVVRSFATSITRYTRVMEDREPGSTGLDASSSSSECSDEFSSDSTSSDESSSSSGGSSSS
ncbi:hypothetical protein BO94DRAFT_539761 [Aspergillus sclerotioniger CBS 115572]|uniref:Uncharacterized protein n=1 Tax=Aspergillus sclerotioniger CBS 115572 TaxID=1450535 RepID=A0A317V8C5_9EURO|nr:hypothetical protein BO94DRAFT_539761 [Aspergillus sclerotioniger CBS 115572]PWY70305.1 hypothetical protein BO94DRAFT_539761 [Aspergillus sclerotioniger CBS 115572]